MKESREEKKSENQTLVDQIRALFVAEASAGDTVLALANGVRSLTNADLTWVRNFGSGGEATSKSDNSVGWKYEQGFLKATEFACGQVFCSSKFHYCPDTSTLDYKDDYDEKLTISPKSILTLPLITHAGVEGFIIVAAARKNAFSDQDISSGFAISDFGAMALSRIRSQEHNVKLKIDRDQALDKVLESEQRLRAIIGAVRDGMIIRSVDGSILSANPGAFNILRFPVNQLYTGDENGEWLLVNEKREEISSNTLPDKAALETGMPQPEVTVGIERCDGTVTWLSMSAGPVCLMGQSEAYAVVLSFSDITERKNSFDANARLAAIVDSTQDAIMCATLDGTIVSWNRGAEKLFGYLAVESIGLESPVLMPPHDRKSFKLIVERLHAGTVDESAECVRFRNDGIPVHVSMTYSLVRNVIGEPIAVAAIARDVTDRVRNEQQIKEQIDKIAEFNEELQAQQDELLLANERLASLATLDGLTSLKNHRYFQERLHEEVERSARYALPLSMFILDVDSFKEYNDTHGHPAGDFILKTVSQLLVANCRASDIVARYGGEEFVIILPQTNSDGARVIAERCRKVIENYHWPLRKITASFGVSTFGDGIVTASEFLSAGDKAMYVSKRGGKNSVTHSLDIAAKKKPLKKAA